VKKDYLIPYHKHALRLLNWLETVKLEHVSSGANKMVDALVNLSTTLVLGVEENINVPVCRPWVVTPLDDDSNDEVKVVSACVVDKEDWHQPLID